MRFCTDCGGELSPTCSKCGFRNPSAAKFCGQCATRLAADETTVPSSRRAAERRQLTVLFCDVVNASGLSQELDPEDLRDVLRQYQTLCAEAVRRFDGHVAQYLGDGLLVYFGYPLAHEDAPQRALRAGLAIVQSIREWRPRLEESAGVGVEVRVGVHTGPVVVGEMGGAEGSELLAVGKTPNLAARVQAAAEPDTVVASEATYRLTQGYFTFRELGSQSLKGFSHPVGLYQALGETEAKSRLDVAAASGLTPFLGRQHEMEALLAQWSQAKAGQRTVVLIAGDPGMGKSRLARALKERLSGEEFVALDCSCSAFSQSTALQPITEMIERQLGFNGETSAQEKLELLESELHRGALDSMNAVSLLAALLSIPAADHYPRLDHAPLKLRQLTFEALIRWIQRAGGDRPLLLLVEDLQLADPSTLDLLGALIEREPPSPMMLLVTHRTEFHHPWRTARQFCELALGRLGAEDTEKILTHVAGQRGLSVEVANQVLAKADGIPLFIEEITKAVLEVSSPRQGERSSTPTMIPSTIEDSLTARLDRMGTSKSVAQLAATIGKSFQFRLLFAVANMDERSLRAELDRLVGAELLQRSGEAPNESYVFKHALICDAAYESLLRSARQRFHRQIALTLAERFPDIAGARPDLLGLHYAAAGLAAEAIGQWSLAGQRAVARSAFAEAIHAFTQAIDLLMLQPPSPERARQEIGLRAGIGLAFLTTKGFSAREVEDTYKRAAELCDELGDTPLRVLYGIWAVHVVRGDLVATQRMVLHFERLCTGGDRLARLVAHSCVATFAHWRADSARALMHGRAAMALCDTDDPAAQHLALLREYGLDSPLYGLMAVTWTELFSGKADQARRTLESALSLAERIADPYVLTMARTFAAQLYLELGAVTLAERMADLARTVSLERDYLFWLGQASMQSGRAMVRRGLLDSGVARIREGLGLMQMIGHNFPLYLVHLAEACVAANRIDEATAALDEALSMVSIKLERLYEPELWRIKGQVSLLCGRADEGEAYLRQSLACARERGAKLLELRATNVLAGLLAARGQAHEARELVRGVYRFFAEGFDLPDLEAAKKFLARSEPPG